MDVYLSEEQIKKARLFFRLKVYAVFMLTALTLIGVFYLIALSPIFKMEKIDVNGEERLSGSEVISEMKIKILRGPLSKILGFHNYLAWRENLSFENPLLASILIEKRFWDRTIKISVQERQKYGIWCFNDSDERFRVAEGQRPKARYSDTCYWFDKDGVIFENASDTEGYLVVKIIDSSAEKPILGKQIIEGRFLDNFIKILESLKTLNLDVREFSIDHLLQELKAKTLQGPEIFFSLRFDPAFSISALKALKEKMPIKNISYIDLRVENRIYYQNPSQ